MAQRDAKGRVNWQNLIENLKFFLKVLFLGHIVADKVLLLNSKKTNEQLKKKMKKTKKKKEKKQRKQNRPTKDKKKFIKR